MNNPMAIRVRDTFRDSVRELKNTRSLAIAAMLLALQIVIRQYVTVNIGGSLRVGFDYLALAVSGALFGPFVAMMAGALSDILAYFLGGATATGAYFPGFTVTALLSGLTYGYAFYKRDVKLLHIIIARLIVTVLLNLGLNTFWLYLMQGNAVWVNIPMRALTNAVTFAISVVLMLPFIRNVRRFLVRVPRR